MTRIRTIGALASLAVLLAAGPAAAQSSAKLIKTIKDWSAYAYAADGGKKVCFVTSQPKDSEPKIEGRSGVFFYLSYFPLEGVEREVSIKLGHKAKPGSDVVVSVGNESVKFFVKDDRAFIESPADEKRFVGLLRKGEKMTVKSTTGKGGATATDVFSLFGLSSAMKEAEGACQ